MIDAILIFLIRSTALVVFILGFFSLTLAWWILFHRCSPSSPSAMSGLTLSRPCRVGMRAARIEMRTWNGGTMFLLWRSCSHLFWFSVGV